MGRPERRTPVVTGRYTACNLSLWDSRIAEYKTKARLPGGGHMRVSCLISRSEGDPATALAPDEAVAEALIAKLSELKTIKLVRHWILRGVAVAFAAYHASEHPTSNGPWKVLEPQEMK